MTHLQFLPINLEADFETCFEFRRDAFTASFGSNEALWPQEADKSEYLVWLQKKTVQDPHGFLHLWENQKIIGQVELSRMKGKPDCGYINFFYLRPEYRGHDYGVRLEEMARTYFLQKGLSRAYLSVSPKNERAIGFYEKQGWKDQGPRPSSPEVRFMSKVFFKADWKLQFYREAQIFLDFIFADLEKNKIDIEFWPVDHICYRTESAQNYQDTIREISEFAFLMAETMVNGRKIATFRLAQPLWHRGRTIELVEVPAPKPGKMTPRGFEHIEVVTSQTFAELQNKYAHLNLNTKGLSKEINQELEIEFDTRAIKFHYYSLADVIRIESCEPLAKALQAGQVLTKLKPFQPLVAGTYPLGLTHENSDVDVSCCYSEADEEKLQELMQSHFGHLPSWQIQTKWLSQEKSVIFRFVVDGLNFEVVFQKGESHMQRSFRHMQIESRLLGLMKPAQMAQLQLLRQKKIKTEPAFLQALEHTEIEDSFEFLLQIHKLPEVQLRQLLKLGI